MRTTSSQKLKIGLFVIVGLAILFLGIFLIGNQKSMFNSTFSVSGTFKNVNGLMVGNNVRFAGINVGVVEDINIVTDSTVKVDLTINENVRKFIKKDAKVSIGSDGLMGDKLIVITPGKTNAEVVNSGDQLAAVNPVDVDKIIGKLTRVADNAEKITTSLSGIFEDVNNGKGTLGRLLHNDRMAKDLETTVASAKSTVKNVNAATTTLHEDLKAAQHNFLLRGFFKKKQKAAQERQDSIKKAQEKLQKQQEKEQKRLAKEEKKRQDSIRKAQKQ
ncbi:MlaD family protein [Mucilaginibacter sp. RS28]|uniref:MlaD family protein n=1 Tax=Mucilaginibacter straminoryzae TaxID=2932774 RepID=A0A9X1X695_9SPHI|nr:MlaD family protein [Mucilaginibacter straminoryzae]MCJ8210418.1 MlaD family protein [Mucilaginibacter straminoryzae]